MRLHMFQPPTPPFRTPCSGFGDDPAGGHSETLATTSAATATKGQGSDGGTVASASQMMVEVSTTSAEAPQDQATGEAGVGVFSFGRGDLGALLHSDDVDHSAEEGPVVVKNHRSLLQVRRASFLLLRGRYGCLSLRSCRFQILG